MTKQFIVFHQELRVYQLAFENAMQIFELSREFPTEERNLLRRQMVQSSRSVCGSVAEGWCKRRFKGAFIAKLNEAEAEAAETQTWIEFAIMCSYLDTEVGQELHQRYRELLAGLARMIENADAWTIDRRKRKEHEGGNREE